MNIEEFGTYIAAKRKEQNMTQKELAEKLNVTPKAVSRWERSVGYPDLESFENLASALNITVMDLFACHDANGEINTHDVMKIVRNSVEIDRKNSRTQEKAVSGIIIAVTIMTGFLFYVGGYGNIGASLFFGLMSAGIITSLYYWLSEDSAKSAKAYMILFAVLTAVVGAILIYVLHSH